jgi:hypothetical protein
MKIRHFVEDTNQLFCVGEEVLMLRSQKMYGFMKMLEAAALDILTLLAVIFFTLHVFLTSR